MTVTGEPAISFRLSDLACPDPYPALARLRARDPVHRTVDGAWLLTRYADVDRVLRSRSFGAPVTKDFVREMVGTGALFEYMSRRLANYNPPDHTRVRHAMGHAFTRLGALAERLGYRPTEVHENVAPPRQVVVQRGHTALAEQLRARTPPGVPVISDRRTRERRASGEPITNDQRRHDRRRSPSVTWGALGFFIVPLEKDSP